MPSFFSDDNARRRNLIILSLALILYFVAGGHTKSDEELGLLFSNLYAERDWAVAVFVWALQIWFYVQFSYNTSSFHHEYHKDMEFLTFGNQGDINKNQKIEERFVRGEQNPFLIKTKQFLTKRISHPKQLKAFFENYQDIRINDASLTTFMPKEKKLFPYARFHIKYRDKSAPRTPNKQPILRPLNLFEHLYILQIHICCRPYFNDIALPKILAWLAFSLLLINLFGFFWPAFMFSLFLLFKLLNKPITSLPPK